LGPDLTEPRVLICGSRRWPYRRTVEAVLDRLALRHGDGLVVIEGAANGADAAAHRWCLGQGFGTDRHRCHPVDWAEARRTRPESWRVAGHERNMRMLLQERPQLIVAFHDHFDAASGGTSDMCARALLQDVPAWLVPGENPSLGRWLRPGVFPSARLARLRRELDAAAATEA